jgi:chorismate synthase
LNTFGRFFRITTFGESHGPAVGVIIDGCPAGLDFDLEMLKTDLSRRRPGQSALTTDRDEPDQPQVLSGVFEGKTLGTPIAIQVLNKDQQSKDYGHLSKVYRPSHADFTWETKFGHRDHRGGGRASARETVARVAAGAVARMLLKHAQVQVWSYVSALGAIETKKPYTDFESYMVDEHITRCPDKEVAIQMEAYLLDIKQKGETAGGIITTVVTGYPAGLGSPVFNKLHADLGHAILGINACKGFEIGDGFAGATQPGSVQNDSFTTDESGKVRTRTNHSGGMQGGISNGMDIWFRAAFKPVSTLQIEQQTIDNQGNPTTVIGKGRHDPSVLPRAVPIVEAMTCLVLADHWLAGRLDRLHI